METIRLPLLALVLSTGVVATGFAQSPVVINEFLADNDTVDRDNAGDYDDWVELYNRSQSVYDLTGHYLTDDLTRPKRWQFPNGTKIPAGGFLRIWCDNEPTEGPLHATFKLDDAGEDIGLFGPDAQSNPKLDGLTYAKQRGDRSFGRLPDGGDSWFYLWTPSGEKPALGVTPFLRYDSRRTGAVSNIRLKGSGIPRVNFVTGIDFSNGPAKGVVVLLVSGDRASIDLGALGFLCVSPVGMGLIPVGLDAVGDGSFRFTVPPVLGGVVVYFQGFSVGHDLSNALAVSFAK